MISRQKHSAIIQNLNFKIQNFVLVLFLMLSPSLLFAQEFAPIAELPTPKGAFLRSIVIPGWGHHYVDKTNWTRGQVHLAADVVMVLSYAGFKVRGNQLRTELETFALSNAGTNLDGRDREFQLAVANYDDLESYNDFQLRSRNWDNILPNVSANSWNWNEDTNRFQFQNMRERVDRNEGQFSTIITLMVVNRLFSALSAYNRARNVWDNAPQASLSYLNELGQPGVTAQLRFEF